MCTPPNLDTHFRFFTRTHNERYLAQHVHNSLSFVYTRIPDIWVVHGRSRTKLCALLSCCLSSSFSPPKLPLPQTIDKLKSEFGNIRLCPRLTYINWYGDVWMHGCICMHICMCMHAYIHEYTSMYGNNRLGDECDAVSMCVCVFVSV